MRSIRAHVVVGCIAILGHALFGGCSEEDTTAPPAPSIDPVVTPTNSTTQWVTGSAEYGSTVTISGGLEVVTPVADSFSATWWAVVELNTTVAAGETGVTTTLSVTATDLKGNESEAATADIVFDSMAGPPTVRIASINGFGICTDGTLQSVVPADCTNADPAITFFPGQVVLMEVEVNDGAGVAEVTYNATGFGVRQDGFALIAEGEQTARNALTIPFLFNINGGAINGDVVVVAQAVDIDGMITNSAAALIRIDLGLLGEGGRTIEIIAGGDLLNSPTDVAYNPDGSILISNRDNADPTVWKIDGTQVSYFAGFDRNDPPEFIVVDASGNVYITLDNADEVWQIAPDGTETLYQSQGDPEGLAVLGSATPSTGQIGFGGNAPQDEDCLQIGTLVYEFDSAGGCAGAGGNCGAAQDVCLSFTAGDLDSARTALETEIDTNRADLDAALADDCENRGDACVFVVATTAGAVTDIPITSARGNFDLVDVSGGEDASLLYMADRANNQLIYEFRAPSSPEAAELNTYDPNLRPRGIAVALRGTPERLFLYAAEDGNDEVREYDVGTRTERLIANRNDGVRGPWGLVITANDCLIVSNEGSGEILAYDLKVANPTAELIADGFDKPKGLALEGTGETANLLVADDGFELVARISPTAATGDCF